MSNYAIINRFRDGNGEMITAGVYGPFSSRIEAWVWNRDNFPNPEDNDVAPMHSVSV